MKLYFAVTPTEVKKGYVTYPVTKNYSLKGVHNSLSSLKSFIKDNFKESYPVFSYVKLDSKLDKLDIDYGVIVEDNVVSVKLPISFSLKTKLLSRCF
jgi:hypothetical protein